MIEDKRFVDYFDKEHNYIIQDLENEDEYQVGFVNCDEDIFLELVNGLDGTVKDLSKDYQKLMEENEQLKSDLDYFERTYEIIEKGLDIEPAMCTITSSTPTRKELLKENEQLKSFIKKVANKNGNIYLANGGLYRIKEVLKE